MRNVRGLTTLLAICGAAALLLASAGTAGAARNLDYGFVEDQFGDDLLTSSNPKVANRWWKRNKRTNSSVVRINMYWSQVAIGGEPDNPKDPADPAYDWSIPDRTLRQAKRRGIDVVFTVFLAPRWAEGPNRPANENESRIGTWRPDAKAYRKFAIAVGKRYSGKYGKVPRVKYFEAWNEPNLPQYITPQWDGKRAVSPNIYRDLLVNFYKGVRKGYRSAGVKRANKKVKVITAGTSPFGDPPGGKRMRPYYFWREVFCLKHNKKLKKKKRCKRNNPKAKFDIYAHNAINAKKGKGPKSKPPHPDAGVPRNFKDLKKIVRKAKKRKTIKRGRKQAWVTETWYESRPPEKKAVGLKRQARFMQEALYVLWKQKVKTVFFLQLRDTEYDPSLPPLVGFQTGVYLPNGRPKPSLQGVRFPFVADRKNKKKVLIWGIAPKSGKLKIKDKKKGKLKKIRVKRGKVFKTKVRLRKRKGKYKLRGKVRKSKSLTWKQR